MRIQAADLHRLFYNAQLFSNKTSAAGGNIRVLLTEKQMAVVATDDHVVLSDWAPLETTDANYYDVLLSLESMKAIEKWSREPKGTVDVAFDGDNILFRDSADTESIGVLGAVTFFTDREFWMSVTALVVGEDFSDERPGGPALTTFALNPDRLRKFSLVKPGDGPIDMQTGYDNAIERDVIRWKAGLSCRGVLAPLDRTVIRESLDPGMLW